MRHVSILAVLLAASFAIAAPPKVKDSDPIPEGGFADLSLDVPKGASVIWRISPQPVQRANDLPTGRLVFGGKKGTTYTATAIIIDFDKKTVTDADYTFTFAGTPAIDPPKEKDPPTKDPPTSSLYFLIVRANGPSSLPFTRIMEDRAWDTLRAAGHLVKDIEADRAKSLGYAFTAANLPVVITLREGATSSTVVRGEIPLPTNSVGILDLPKGVN